MKQKQPTAWLQKWLCPIVAGAAVGVVVTSYPAVAMFGKSGSDASISNPQALDAVTSKPVSVNWSIQHEQTALAAQARNITVYRSPSCGCCSEWIDYMKKQGFQTKDVLTSDLEAVKQKYKVPDKLTSCHTAVINGYAIEGHVPVNDIKRLLQEKPNVAGISVPQMPVGTPGMEAGDRRDPFTVFSFDKNGTAKVFNKYPSS
jgi:hypothetical protein